MPATRKTARPLACPQCTHRPFFNASQSCSHDDATNLLTHLATKRLSKRCRAKKSSRAVSALYSVAYLSYRNFDFDLIANMPLLSLAQGVDNGFESLIPMCVIIISACPRSGLYFALPSVHCNKRFKPCSRSSLNIYCSLLGGSNQSFEWPCSLDGW